MNNKAVMRIVVAVWAYIIWVVIIIAFVILFNLKSTTIDQTGHTLQGKIGLGPEHSQELLAYLQTPISACDLDTTTLGIQRNSDFYKELKTNPQLTYATMLEIGIDALDKRVNLADMEEILQGELKNVERTRNLQYLKVWYQCTKTHLMKVDETKTSSFSNSDINFQRENDFIVNINNKNIIAPDNYGGGRSSQQWQAMNGDTITLRIIEPPRQHDTNRK